LSREAAGLPDVSIAIIAQDRYSSAITKMADNTKKFNKDQEQMQTLLEKFSANKYSLKLDLDRAMNDLKAAQKQFAATGDEADRLTMQMEGIKVDNLSRNLT
jgi:hypothetical protein